MADEKDIWWGLYQEHTTQGRHHEEQRAAVTNLLIAISAAVLGVITYDNHLGQEDLPMAVFLVVIGAFGALFAAKHYERFRMHMEIAKMFRDELERSVPNSRIGILKGAGVKVHEANYPRLSQLKLFRFWTALYSLIVVLGLALTAMAIA